MPEIKLSKGMRVRVIGEGYGRCWFSRSCMNAERDGSIFLLEFDPSPEGFRTWKDGMCRSCWAFISRDNGYVE